MSLVLCSNKKLDADDFQQDGSIFKPYSFRNSLSSMYRIPKNAQVALQSIKYALNGNIPLTTNGRILYQYFGEILDEKAEQGGGNSANKSMYVNSTSVPIRTPLVDTLQPQDVFNGSYPTSQQNKVRNYTINSLARAMRDSLNNYIYHPNLRGHVTVAVNRDPSTNVFAGFRIGYDFPETVEENIPQESIDWSSHEVRDGDIDQSWNYEDGTFTTGAPNDQGTPQGCMLTDQPISANGGVLEVDFSNANGAGKEWAVGLSRFVNTADDITGNAVVPYFSLLKSGEERPTRRIGFYDYVVCRKGNELKVYHTPYDNTNGLNDNNICSRELELNGAVEQNYDLDTNATAYTKVRFTVNGQQVKIELIHAGADDVVYEYNEEHSTAQQLKAICISNWNMYPVLYIEDPDLGSTNSMDVTSFIGCPMPFDWTYDGTNLLTGEASWYNAQEESNDLSVAREVETRPWNDQSVGGRVNFLPYSGIVGGLFNEDQFDNFLILQPSDIYAPSEGANTETFLGFVGESPTNSWIIDPEIETTKYFISSSIPQLLSNKSIFVKLNNFTQQSVNAIQGNQSTIIAHIPRFDGQVQVGRMYHEPNTLVYLDLNNSSELNINSFDISLVYSNEQYVEELAGQTIVMLHIRQKPD